MDREWDIINNKDAENELINTKKNKENNYQIIIEKQ